MSQLWESMIIKYCQAFQVQMKRKHQRKIKMMIKIPKIPRVVVLLKMEEVNFRNQKPNN